MPKLAQILKTSSGSRQVCVSVFFFSDHRIKQIDSMLPWVCSVIDHRRRQNVVKTSDTFAGGSCATSLFLRHFDVICDLLLNRRTATWNLFVKQIFKKPLDIFSPQIERKRFKEYLVIILAVKERFEWFLCLEFVFEKSKHREAGLKHKLQL